MESTHVLSRAVKSKGVKSVAAGMKLSASTIYKWCESTQDKVSSGAVNPLDRVAQLYELTGDKGLVAWLCQRAGGMYVANPEINTRTTSPIKVTRKMLKEFSDLLEVVSESLDDDGYIDTGESENIRDEWENLKMVTESFVFACERGTYNTKRHARSRHHAF